MAVGHGGKSLVPARPIRRGRGRKGPVRVVRARGVADRPAVVRVRKDSISCSSRGRTISRI